MSYVSFPTTCSPGDPVWQGTSAQRKRGEGGLSDKPTKALAAGGVDRQRRTLRRGEEACPSESRH